jgi:hypothetical protein
MVVRLRPQLLRARPAGRMGLDSNRRRLVVGTGLRLLQMARRSRGTTSVSTASAPLLVVSISLPSSLPATHGDANSAETHPHSAASDTNTAGTHADSANAHSASVRSDADSLETDADSTNSNATAAVADTVPACFTDAETQDR